MSKLVIGFSYAPSKPFSWLIRLVTKSNISHAFVLLADSGQVIVYQASGMAVNYQAYDIFLQKEKIVELYSFDVSDANLLQNKKFRLVNVGKPYGLAEIFGFAWVLMNRTFGKTVKNPWSGGDHAYVCVDIAAVHLDIKKEDGTMTPEDLRRWCRKNGGTLLSNH